MRKIITLIRAHGLLNRAHGLLSRAHELVICAHDLVIARVLLVKIIIEPCNHGLRIKSVRTDY